MAREKRVRSSHPTASAARVTEKAERIAEKAAAKVERASAELARSAAQLDRLSAQLATLDIWTRPEPGVRKPRFTRETIAAAAVHIADTEGFDALSMRRLAAELDAGTMTLYHYVRTKDELLSLVADAVMGELVVPDDEMPEHWRDALIVIAHRSRAALLRHPWALDIHDDPAPGPNMMRHFDQSMQAVASLDLGVGERFELVSAVDEYTFGFCMIERQGFEDDKQVTDRLLEYVRERLATGDYPTLAAMDAETGLGAALDEFQRVNADPERFERNLRRLLDGFDAEFSRR
jgi:AcrR family transcriptional regulator